MIDGTTVIHYWDRWQANKGKRGYNTIPTDPMKQPLLKRKKNIEQKLAFQFIYGTSTIVKIATQQKTGRFLNEEDIKYLFFRI